MRCINLRLDKFQSNKICSKLSVYILLKMKLKQVADGGEYDHAKNLILEQRQSPVSRFAKSFAFVKKYHDFSE